MNRPGFILLLLVVMLIGRLPMMASAEHDLIDAQDGLTVSRYCEKFARTYSEDHAMEYQERSASIERQSDGLMWLSNLFQPPHAKFTAGYECHFHAGRKGESAQKISVGVFLAKTRISPNTRSGRTCKPFRSSMWWTRPTTGRATGSSSIWNALEASGLTYRSAKNSN